ncbi:uncharacterized protein LOC126894884 isoform X2 [Daktulosphaira vitifoliae]|uniref:uncharacterized protein LOC126894884 isoform X2 n=1 Tax=Daktulosphaira vitifoliae TaxID=58002 RepID=UPI0021AB0A3F|nr:uncharacterized protein LOC126894884 isoform X2 [Daktulosphaira vitifoliae]
MKYKKIGLQVKEPYYFLQYLFVFVTTIVIVTVYHVQRELVRPKLEHLVIYQNLTERDSRVNCQFPILHPFHASILKYVFIPKPIRCMERSYRLTFIDMNTGLLQFNKSGFKESGYSLKSNGLKCNYQEIYRPKNDDFHVIYGPQIPIIDLHEPQTDFVFVSCVNFIGLTVYSNFHAYARRRPEVRKFKNHDELGVAVIGIDSISRLNFMRQMPKSYNFLTKEIDGDVMYGFTKVGENTFPNVIPMLTGRPFLTEHNNRFDDWPYIWKDFFREKVATLYAEDQPEFNMFDYLAKGITIQPTLHYMRTFWLAVEQSMLYKMSSPSCLGPTPKHLIYFDYLKSFMKVYRDSPIFLFSLFNEASHDFVNTVGVIDLDYMNFLKSSFEEGLFNRTIVFVLGDHGNRMDFIRRTKIGTIEDRMPMVTLITPEWVKVTYPSWKSSLRDNRMRLTSTFDIYATFRHVLSTINGLNPSTVIYQKALEEINNSIVKSHFSEKSTGISLFNSIPLTRDCNEAGIPQWICVCHEGKQKQLDPNHPYSLAATNKVLNYFNELLEDLQECAKMKLAFVEDVYLYETPQKYNNKVYEKSVQVTFKAQPGDGYFEATLGIETKSQDNDEDFVIIGQVFRINKYGHQADCLPRIKLAKMPILKGICYCD